MQNIDRVRLLLALVLGLTAVAPAHATAAAQSTTWDQGWARPGRGAVHDVAVVDFGAGPALYVSTAQYHTLLGPGRIDHWNGLSWENVLQAPIWLEHLAGGTIAGTPALFAAQYTGFATSTLLRWDGLAWSTIGQTSGGRVDCLEVLDDHSGAALYVGGSFTHLNAVPMPRLAKWDGAGWSGNATGLIRDPFCIEVHDAGGGPRLYVGINSASSTSSVFSFDGVQWNTVGALSGYIRDLQTADLGAGQRLYAAASRGLRVWDGSAWTALSNGAYVMELGLLDLGAGPQLFLQGSFTALAGTPCQNIGRYDGNNFFALAGGTSAVADNTPELGVDWSTGTARLVATHIESADGQSCDGLALWDGTSWSMLGRGTNGRVDDLARYDLGSGAQLFACGAFTSAGGAAGRVLAVASWNGTRWSAMGSLPGDVRAVCGADVGSGPRLYAAGRLPLAASGGIVGWNGTAWTAVGPATGLNGEGHVLFEHDDGSGSRLFVGGNFPLGGAPTVGQRIAAWNGSAWSNLAGGMNDIVYALERHDEGGGARLFAAGNFTTAGGGAASRIARWNGSAWSALGTGLNGTVRALASFDDGAGAQLYAGGAFTLAGVVPVQFLARWNGTSWSNVPGGGANGAVLALHVYDDGRGPALYVGGGFGTIGGVTAYNVARFDGASWEAVDGGFDLPVLTLASLDDDGDGDPDLFAGGEFENTTTHASGYIARLPGRPHYTSFCFGDGTLADHTTPCPCANDGAPGHGCANAFDPNGALLQASGSTNPDALVLAGSGMPLTAFGIYLQHDAPGDRVFHDGVICAGGNLLRLRNRNALGGQSTYPNSSDTQTVSQRGQVTPGSGATRDYSLFYRAASPTFCPPATANVTNGVRVVW